MKSITPALFETGFGVLCLMFETGFGPVAATGRQGVFAPVFGCVRRLCSNRWTEFLETWIYQDPIRFGF